MDGYYPLLNMSSLISEEMWPTQLDFRMTTSKKPITIPTQPVEFHQFVQLPVEIQLMIWARTWRRRTIYIAGSRITWISDTDGNYASPVWDVSYLDAWRCQKMYGNIELADRQKVARPNHKRVPRITKITVVPGTNNPVAHHVRNYRDFLLFPSSAYVHSVSRQETLRVYQPVIFAREAARMLIKTLFVHPEMDILHVSGCAARPGSNPFSLSAVARDSWGQLRRLSLDASVLNSELFDDIRRGFGQTPARHAILHSVAHYPYETHRGAVDTLVRFIAKGAPNLQCVNIHRLMKDFGNDSSHPRFSDNIEYWFGISRDFAIVDHHIRLVRLRGDEIRFGGNGQALPKNLQAVLWDDAPRYDHGWALFNVFPVRALDPDGVRNVDKWRTKSRKVGHEMLTKEPGWGTSLAADFNLAWRAFCIEVALGMSRTEGWVIRLPQHEIYHNYINKSSTLCAFHGICTDRFGFD